MMRAGLMLALLSIGVACTEEPVATAEWQGATSPESLAKLASALQAELGADGAGAWRVEPGDNGRVALFAGGAIDMARRDQLIVQLNQLAAPVTSEVTLTFDELPSADANDSLVEQALRAEGRPTGAHKTRVDWRQARVVPVSERESGGSLLAPRHGPVSCELRLPTDRALPELVARPQASAGNDATDTQRSTLALITLTLTRMKLVYPHRFDFTDPALTALPAAGMTTSPRAVTVNLGALSGATASTGVDVGNVLHDACEEMLRADYPATSAKMAQAQRFNGLAAVESNPRWRPASR